MELFQGKVKKKMRITLYGRVKKKMKFFGGEALIFTKFFGVGPIFYGSLQGRMQFYLIFRR